MTVMFENRASVSRGQPFQAVVEKVWDSRTVDLRVPELGDRVFVSVRYDADPNPVWRWYYAE